MRQAYRQVRAARLGRGSGGGGCWVLGGCVTAFDSRATWVGREGSGHGEAPTPAPTTPARSIADFLDWAEQHPHAAVRKHAKQARTALAAIQQRYAADTELDQVQQEVERARKRLAALEARAKELARPGAKAAPARDYDMDEVRAWAQRAGVACPAFGKIPAAVLAAWRERNAA